MFREKFHCKITSFFGGGDKIRFDLFFGRHMKGVTIFPTKLFYDYKIQWLGSILTRKKATHKF